MSSDLPYGMSPEEYAQSMGIVARYKESAAAAVELLMKAHAEDNPQAGALVVSQIFAAQDEMYLMMVLGHFTGMVALYRRQQAEPHGPLVTLTEQGLKPNPQTWHTSVYDQLQASAENNDYIAYGQIMVDGQLRALAFDQQDPQYTVDFDHVMRAMLTLDQVSLVMMATEALLRLTKGP